MSPARQFERLGMVETKAVPTGLAAPLAAMAMCVTVDTPAVNEPAGKKQLPVQACVVRLELQRGLRDRVGVDGRCAIRGRIGGRGRDRHQHEAEKKRRSPRGR